jgi:LCP family protein required for cell wall assembly
VLILGTVVAVLAVSAKPLVQLVLNWELSKFHKVTVASLKSVDPTKPFNILVLGSDSRAGLTGQLANATGAGSVSGARNDVTKIIHVDPIADSISTISIPRDTLVSLLKNQNLFTAYNRINVNDDPSLGGGPDLVVKTIEANFGIPINHVVVVSFAGVINAADAIGGVNLNFPTPLRDTMSGTYIRTAGCHNIQGGQALSLMRGRHTYYYSNGQWLYDGTSDYGRIIRQDMFIKGMLQRAKASIYSPDQLSALIGALPQGIALDSSWSGPEILGLGLHFRHFNTANLHSYTLPVTSPGLIRPYGDVLVVQQPEAQQLFVKVFGANGLINVTNPPPNARLQPIIPPVVTTTTAPPAGSSTGSTGSTTVTTPTRDVPWWDPSLC